MLYFAYGSNLHHQQMKKRCGDSIFLKKINLKDFKLTFRSKYKAADIQKKKNQLSLVHCLKYLKMMKKNSMYMKIFQYCTKSIILDIMEKKS